MAGWPNVVLEEGEVNWGAVVYVTIVCHTFYVYAYDEPRRSTTEQSCMSGLAITAAAVGEYGGGGRCMVITAAAVVDYGGGGR